MLRHLILLVAVKVVCSAYTLKMRDVWVRYTLCTRRVTMGWPPIDIDSVEVTA